MNVDKLISDLSKDQIIELVNTLLQRAELDVERCWECKKLTTDFIEECESYDNYTETLCTKCAQYCEGCCTYYTSAGEYQHEYCEE